MISLSNISLSDKDIMYVVLASIVLLCTFYLFRLNNDKKSDIYIVDLITENGHLEERKFTRFGAWLVSTWGFVYLIVEQQLSEWYFVGYMGAWVANALIGKSLSISETKKENKDE